MHDVVGICWEERGGVKRGGTRLFLQRDGLTNAREITTKKKNTAVHMREDAKKKGKGGTTFAWHPVGFSERFCAR